LPLSRGDQTAGRDVDSAEPGTRQAGTHRSLPRFLGLPRRPGPPGEAKGKGRPALHPGGGGAAAKEDKRHDSLRTPAATKSAPHLSPPSAAAACTPPGPGRQARARVNSAPPTHPLTAGARPSSGSAARRARPVRRPPPLRLSVAFYTVLCACATARARRRVGGNRGPPGQ
jgi:hypothetical protein